MFDLVSFVLHDIHEYVSDNKIFVKSDVSEYVVLVEAWDPSNVKSLEPVTHDLPVIVSQSLQSNVLLWFRERIL